ncbi:hypothetical protein BV22DRAFT_1036379 [Leucogyrophana mollusca]|uniref:Uncharacterized protein n=1 Tax=Leucogyrophana mollusca TaxID=85980 RepID=A0ACB8BDV7_9AGAM|nr:hypothetical protein BV22DRAFT_1036379 [Leucogyrophana mollusca]
MLRASWVPWGVSGNTATARANRIVVKALPRNRRLRRIWALYFGAYDSSVSVTIIRGSFLFQTVSGISGGLLRKRVLLNQASDRESGPPHFLAIATRSSMNKTKPVGGEQGQN